MKKWIKTMILLTATALILAVFGGCSGGTSEPKSRLDDILERGYIEVVTEPYFAPFEFIDPSKGEDEQVVGSDIELAKYIADELGVELRVVPLEFGAVLSSITEGKYDLAISALAYKPDRAEAMNLSKGYYFTDTSTSHGLLIRAEDANVITGPDDIADKIIVAQSGSLQEMYVEQQIPAYKEFKRVSSTNDGFLEVQEGKADVCATATKTAQLYIDANPDCGLMVIDTFYFAVDETTAGTRIGIPPGEDELTDRINEIIDDVVESGLYKQWYDDNADYASELGL